MKIAILGSGGREHAIAVQISNSPKLKKLYCIPGNAGTGFIAQNINADIDNFEEIGKIVENYKIMSSLNLVDSVLGVGLPYMASAFGIFLLRQTFKTIPKELEEAARVEGCKIFGVLLRVYVPLAKPTYLAYGLVSVSYHWNNFLWPLIVTNSVNTRPLTVGLAIFGAPESGVNWSVISAATLLSVSPLLLGFILFQKQFIQSFMYAGIK